MSANVVLARYARKFRRRRGQTLIALLVVLLIIAILAGTLYPKIAGRGEYDSKGNVKGAATPIDRAYDIGCTEYMSQVAQAAGMYRQDHNAPPPDLQALKRYGVTDEMINTPNCNFGIPKYAPQQLNSTPSTVSPNGVTTVYGANPASQPPPQQAPAGLPQRPGTTTIYPGGGYSMHIPSNMGGGSDAGAAAGGDQ